MSYLTCPKCRHTRQPQDVAPAGQCPACGLVFAKFVARQLGGDLPVRRQAEADDDSEGPVRWLLAHAWPEPRRADSAWLLPEAALLLALMVWSLWFVASGWRSGEAGQSFMHLVNLPFHEFGHLLFSPFGEWMMFAGGSLFQLLVPLLLAGVFLWRHRNPFAAAVCLWWLGQSVLDLAPYIGDARALELSLVGEWNDQVVEDRAYRHDWHNILGSFNLLHWDHRLAAVAHWLGALGMLAALAYGGAWLLRCRKWARSA